MFKVGDKVRVKPELVGKPCKYGCTFVDGEAVIKNTLEGGCLSVEWTSGECEGGHWLVNSNEVMLIEPEPAIPKVYKALRIKDDKLISLVPTLSFKGIPLEYKEGQITYAPEGSLGIFVDTTFGACKDNALRNKNGAGEIIEVAVYEATPLGKLEQKDVPSQGMRWLCPAILLGKEVWRSEPEKPKEPEWKDVTKECNVQIKVLHSGYYLSVYHAGNWLIEAGYDGVRISLRADYKIEKLPKTYDFCPFRILKRQP